MKKLTGSGILILLIISLIFLTLRDKLKPDAISSASAKAIEDVYITCTKVKITTYKATPEIYCVPFYLTPKLAELWYADKLDP